jgi:hypothetical protein
MLHNDELAVKLHVIPDQFPMPFAHTANIAFLCSLLVRKSVH